MIPAPFDYVRANSVEGAIDALGGDHEEAKILAGGHSLLPLMKLRLAAPTLLVDVGRVEQMRGVRDGGDHLTVGAATTHDEVMNHPLVRDHCGVLADVTAMVGDAQVRHRGTIGGAVAHGDPAGDLPAVLLTTEASLVVQGSGGSREISASDFFVDYLTTALAEDEVLVEVRLPKLDADWSWHYEKFNRVAQAWALVGSLALVHRSNGTFDDVRIGLTNMGSVPQRAAAAEQALQGSGADAIAEAAGHAADGTNPPSDVSATSDYRAHLAQVLTRRALEAASG